MEGLTGKGKGRRETEETLTAFALLLLAPVVCHGESPLLLESLGLRICGSGAVVMPAFVVLGENARTTPFKPDHHPRGWNY